MFHKGTDRRHAIDVDGVQHGYLGRSVVLLNGLKACAGLVRAPLGILQIHFYKDVPSLQSQGYKSCFPTLRIRRPFWGGFTPKPGKTLSVYAHSDCLDPVDVPRKQEIKKKRDFFR